MIGGCVFAARVEPSADQIAPMHIARFHRAKSINPVRTSPSDVELSAAAPLRWMWCWGIASNGPLYDHSRPRSKSSGKVWTPPSSGQMASCRNAAQSTPAWCRRNLPRNKNPEERRGVQPELSIILDKPRPGKVYWPNGGWSASFSC